MVDSKKRLDEPLEGLISALSLAKPHSISWFGETAFRMHANIAAALAPEARTSILYSALKKHLYEHFYLTGGASPLRRTPYITDAGYDDVNFRREILKANALATPVEQWWRVLERRGHWAVLDGPRLRVKLDQKTYAEREETSELLAEEGELLVLRSPTAFERLSPGYIAFRGNGVDLGARILRIYWNVLPRGAAALVNAISDLLGQSEVHFSFKVLDNPAAYGRADTGVLYVRLEDAERIAPLLWKIYSRVSPALRQNGPALTVTLAPGLSAAEDPGDGGSFGMERCSLIADALIAARPQTPRRWREVIREAFDSAGLDFDRPYISAGSDGTWYSILAEREKLHAPRHKLAGLDPAALAQDISTRILRQAIWHKRQCTWMGADNERAHMTRDRQITPLNASLYDGTAGLALLFADMALAEGSSEFRKSSLGALRHAANRSCTEIETATMSAFTGTVGVAWAAACVAELLQSEEAYEIAGQLLSLLNTNAPNDRECDLLTGAAGAVLALIRLEEMGFSTQSTPLLDKSVARLTDSAETNGQGIFWRGADTPRSKPGLTGFSHGACGIAYALAALDNHRGVPQHSALVKGALAYEQSQFDSRQKNWLDLREAHTSKPAFAHYWCHGAPGIGLGRVLIQQFEPNPELKQQARTALQTTASVIQTTSASPDEAHCLCHGLPGNALTLTRAIELWGAPPEALYSKALGDARDAMIEAYSPGANLWGRNSTDAGTPAMMLGEGGIAYYFLSTAGLARSRILDLGRLVQV